jgi:hypothetical protein
MRSHNVASPTAGGVTALLVLLLVGAASLFPGFAPTPPHVAAAAERCDGVWVVVEAAAVGGPNTIRCANGPQSSGFAALEAAGHRYSFVPRVPGMVCTIDSRPDPCNGAPTDAYWSYWHAEAGGTWTYSTRGAGSRTPPPGSVEGWAFGAGEPPRTPPPSNAPQPEPTTTSSPSPSPSPSPTSSPSPTPSPPASPEASSSTSGDGDTTGGSTPADDLPSADPEPETDVEDATDDAASAPPERSGRPTATVTPTPQRTTPAPTASPRGGDEQPPIELRQRDADDEVAIGAPSGGGTTAGLIAGGALASAIAGAGIVQARRRRQAFAP